MGISSGVALASPLLFLVRNIAGTVEQKRIGSFNTSPKVTSMAPRFLVVAAAVSLPVVRIIIVLCLPVFREAGSVWRLTG